MSIASWSYGRQMFPNERLENEQLPTVKDLKFRLALNPLLSRKTEHLSNRFNVLTTKQFHHIQYSRRKKLISNTCLHLFVRRSFEFVL